VTEIDLTVPFHNLIRVEKEEHEQEVGLVTIEPHQKGPPLHLHADQDERWTVITGRLAVRSGSNTLSLGASEVHCVPKGTPHTFWNDSDEPCTFRYELTPGSRFTSMMRTFAMLAKDGRIRSLTDLRSVMHMAQVFVEFGDHVQAVAPPHWVMRLMARAGRSLGVVRRFEAQ